MARTKEKKSISSYAGKPSDKVDKESKTSNYEADDSCSLGMPSQLNNSKFQSLDNSSSVLEGMSGIRSKHQGNTLNKTNTNASSFSESKGRSQIPSLLRFRSSSVSCEVEKQKKKDYPNNEEGTNSIRKPQSSCLSHSTPDRSILSKFFKHGSEEKDVLHEVDSAGEGKDSAKRKRRISRFLRPDFFDTPREESIYAKEKDAKKAAEAENKSKLRKNIKKLVMEKNASQFRVHDTTEIGSSSVLSEERLETNSVSLSSDNINIDKDIANLKNNSKNEQEQNGEEKKTGEQIKSANEMKEKSNNMNDAKRVEKSCSAFEKQPNNSNNKSRFLHSLEKKLEKFRSSGDYIPSASNSGKSRVDKAIHSLREQSLAPRGGDIITSESHLLKRAVSVSDCCTVESSSKSHVPFMKENASSKLGNKVTSVLGLFRKLEDTPVRTCQSSPSRPSVLSHLRRTQSVYAGSQSDSVLLEPSADASGSSEFKPVPCACLKKTTSNSSVVKKKPIEKGGTIQKWDLEASKKTEAQSQNPNLKTLETKTVKYITGVTTENMLASETSLHISDTAHDISIPTKQQESSVPKLLKRGSIKSKTKNITEAGGKAQPKHNKGTESDAESASLLEHGECSKNEVNVRPQTQSKSVCPDSLTGLKGIIPDNVKKVPEVNGTPMMKKLDTDANMHESPSLVTQEVASVVKPVCIPCETGESSDNLFTDKNDFVGREHVGQVSCNSCVDTGKADELKFCTISGNSPTMGNAVDNSPVDDYSLNDDEIKFANVKHLDSYSYPADDSSVLSPADELESFDSWSVCSDFESHEFPTSPLPPPGNDVEESVSDRIRRKSFYSRFNDIKKRNRKSSLSSIGSLSSSYQDTNSLSFLHHPRNFLRKKNHPADYVSSSSHSLYHTLKPRRSQSVYAQSDYDDRPYSRSPFPSRSQHSFLAEGNANLSSTENVTHDMNGYVNDLSSTDKNDLWGDKSKPSLSVDENMQTLSTVGKNMQFLGGSVEALRMPRHFNHNVNSNTSLYHPLYSGTMRRGSDCRLSKSTESSIGASIPKSCLPTIWDRHLPPRFASNSSSVTVTSHPNSAVRLGSVAGETLPLHGKYNR
jgi:hypothetical protein